MAFPAGYTLLAEWELPSITGTHTDFVALLKYADFTANALASIDNGGGDLRFSSDQAGATQLPCEVVEFDKVGLSAQVWVKIPSAFTGQKIYIWGNNTGDSQPVVTDPFGRNAVWSDFELNMHLESDYSDATGGYSFSEQGVGAYIDVGDPSYINSGVSTTVGGLWNSAGITTPDQTSDYISKTFTYNEWLKIPSADTSDFPRWHHLWCKTNTDMMQSNQTDISLTRLGASSDLVVQATGVTTSDVVFVNAVSAITDNAWHKITLTVDFSNTKASLYIDGVLFQSVVNANIGNMVYTASRHLKLYAGHDNGSINSNRDEFSLRFPIAETDSGLILTEYQNQSSPTWGIMTDIVSSGVTADITVQAKKPTVLIQGEATTPAVTADVFVLAKKPAVSIDGSATTPQPIADISVTAKKPFVFIQGEATLPNPTANINITAKKPIVSIFADVEISPVTANINVTAKKPIVFITGEPLVNAVTADISVTAKKPLVSVTGSVTLPNPVADISITTKKPVVQISATVSGLILKAPEDARLVYKLVNNKLNYDVASNKITYNPGSNRLSYN